MSVNGNGTKTLVYWLLGLFASALVLGAAGHISRSEAHYSLVGHPVIVERVNTNLKNIQEDLDDIKATLKRLEDYHKTQESE